MSGTAARPAEVAPVTCIRDCAWIIEWDSAASRHRYANGRDVVFAGDTIIHVGSRYSGPVEVEVSGRGLLVMPGLVDIHSHPSLEPSFKGIREEHGVPEMYMSGLYERSVLLFPDAEGQKACTELAYCEMLLSGVTSIADLSFDYPGWQELAEQSGMRVWLAPWYASSRWMVDNRHELKYRWHDDFGRAAFERAIAHVDRLKDHPSGRLSGMVYPAQIDTCTEEILRDSIAAALERNVPFTTHAAQSVLEFNVMVQRHGKTPIQWANEIGILTPNSIIGHAIFLDQHSWLHWYTRDDLRILVESGCAVAHCPTPFVRYGQVLEDFGLYRRAGVRMGIGTDTIPHNMIEEMRWAAILARVSAESIYTVSTEDIFTAATVGGADALMRTDIGRLAPGMKADLVLVDIDHPGMRPARDPLRSLIYSAADRAVRDVYVGGVKVVGDGRVLTMDMAGAAERAEAAQARMMADVPRNDWMGRDIDAVAPLSLGRL